MSLNFKYMKEVPDEEKHDHVCDDCGETITVACEDSCEDVDESCETCQENSDTSEEEKEDDES